MHLVIYFTGFSLYSKKQKILFVICTASHSRGTKPPCWRAKDALEQDKSTSTSLLFNDLHIEKSKEINI